MSSRWALTKTPATSVRRRIAPATSSASEGLTRRGEPGAKISPTAQAPSSAASSASSRRVMPQILILGTSMRTPPGYARRSACRLRGLVERGRPLAQREVDGALLATAHQGQSHLVARLLADHRIGQVVGAANGLAVDLRDDVAAELDRRAVVQLR